MIELHTFYKKIDNLWYHYKPIIITIFIILLVIILSIPSFKPSTDTALRVVIVGNFIDWDLQQQLEQMSTKQMLGENNAESEIKIEFWPQEEEFGYVDELVLEKLKAMMLAETVDMVIMEKDLFQPLSELGAFLTFEPEQLTNNFSFLNTENSRNLQHLSDGIRIDGVNILKNIGFQTEEKVLGIVNNSEKQNLAVQFANWLFNNESEMK